MPLSDLTWQDTYAKGARRLVRDCRFFVGCTPAVFMKRRKIQLASAWLRCGRRVEEIALALGFPSAWEFQCLFGAFTKRRCATVAAETPLSLMSAYELHEAIAPFYWAHSRPRTSEIQNVYVRNFVRSFAALERRNRLAEVKPRRRPEKRWERPFEETTRKPSGYLSEMFSEEEALRRDDDDPFLQYSAADMRRLAEDFMEMKTTAAELIVPLFKGAPVRRPMAA
jgi:AraC-like DNA-binding protein